MKRLKKKSRNILLGVTSSVACYKALKIASALKERGDFIKTILTPNAAKLISAQLFNAITKDEVFVESFEDRFCNDHIKLSQWADVFIIAPASANTIAKIAAGICDNLLTTAVLSRRCPLYIAPAMEEKMWENPFTQRNISILKKAGIEIIPPRRGFLAGGRIGLGRMAEPEEIIRKVK